jgi:hypothetical protein
MGDSGEGWECIVDVECKDATAEWGDEPGEGAGIIAKAWDTIINDNVIRIKNFFTGEKESEESQPSNFSVLKTQNIRLIAAARQFMLEFFFLSQLCFHSPSANLSHCSFKVFSCAHNLSCYSAYLNYPAPLFLNLVSIYFNKELPLKGMLCCPLLT